MWVGVRQGCRRPGEGWKGPQEAIVTVKGLAQCGSSGSGNECPTLDIFGRNCPCDLLMIGCEGERKGRQRKWEG